MLEVHSNLLHPFGAQPISPPFFNINEDNTILPLLHFQISNVIKIFNTNLNKKERILEYGGGHYAWPPFVIVQYLD